MPVRDSPTRTPRAERYPLVMPIRLRYQPDQPWEAGQTCNVSLTGVLARFRGLALDMGTPVEMVLGLTDEQPGAGHVICVGQVVRVASTMHGACQIAVTIERYRTP